MHWRTWRYRRFHVSYLIGWLALGILLGLLVGRQMVLTSWTPLLCIALVLCLGAFHSQRWWAVAPLVIAGMILGSIRGSIVQSDYKTYSLYDGASIQLRGVMTGDAQTAPGGKQKIVLSQVVIDSHEYPGEVFVSVYGDTELKRGDTVQVKGMLREGFASYGAAMSAAKILAVTRHENSIRDLRERFSSILRSVVVEPMASLGLGFVVGQRSTLPETLDEQLKVVGLTHIVVASGYNLTILVRFVMRLLSRHSRYVAFAVSLVMILGFVLFSGFSPSMNRAVIVTVLGLLAWYVGRRFHPLLLIGYVAAGTAMVNPMYVWADLGWYLSFFAFAGILIVAPLILHLVYRKRKPSPFEQLVFETMGAEVMALPLIAFAFATVPVFGLVANVLVAPFIPAAMLFTAMTGALGFVSGSLSSLVALPTTLLIGYMIAIVEWLAAVPMAQLALDFSLPMLLAWYCLVLVVCLVVKWRLGYDFRTRDRMLEV